MAGEKFTKFYYMKRLFQKYVHGSVSPNSNYIVDDVAIPSAPYSATSGYAIYTVSLYQRDMLTGHDQEVGPVCHTVGGVQYNYRLAKRYEELTGNGSNSIDYMATNAELPRTNGYPSLLCNDMLNLGHITLTNFSGDDYTNATRLQSPYANLMNLTHYMSISQDFKTKRLGELIPLTLNGTWDIGRTTKTRNGGINSSYTSTVVDVSALVYTHPIPPAFKLIYKDPQMRYIVYAALKYTGSTLSSYLNGLTASDLSGSNNSQQPGIYVTEFSDTSMTTYKLLTLTNAEYIKATCDVMLNTNEYIPMIKASGRADSRGIAIIIDETGYYWGDYHATSLFIKKDIDLKHPNHYITYLYPTIFGNYTMMLIYAAGSKITKMCHYTVNNMEVIEAQGGQLFDSNFRMLLNREQVFRTVHQTNRKGDSTYHKPENDRSSVLAKCYDYNRNEYTLELLPSTQFIRFKVNNYVLHEERYDISILDRITHMYGCYIQEDNAILIIAFNNKLTTTGTPTTNPISLSRNTHVYQLYYKIATGEIRSSLKESFDVISNMQLVLPNTANGVRPTVNFGPGQPYAREFDVAYGNGLEYYRTSDGSGGYNYYTRRSFSVDDGAYTSLTGAAYPILNEIGYNRSLFDQKLTLDINNFWDTFILPQTILIHNNVFQAFVMVTEKQPFYTKGHDEIYVRFVLSRFKSPHTDIEPNRTNPGVEPPHYKFVPTPVPPKDTFNVKVEYIRNSVVIHTINLPALQEGTHRQVIDINHDLLNEGVYDIRVTANLNP